jgi:hypothetical protein
MESGCSALGNRFAIVNGDTVTLIEFGHSVGCAA